jgi:hypothetical protein
LTQAISWWAWSFEDQGMLEEIFSSIFEGPGTSLNTVQSHIPFFSAKGAEELLANLKKESSPVAADCS